MRPLFSKLLFSPPSIYFLVESASFALGTILLLSPKQIWPMLDLLVIIMAPFMPVVNIIQQNCLLSEYLSADDHSDPFMHALMMALAERALNALRS